MDPTHIDPYRIDLRVDWSRDPLAELHFQLAAQRTHALSDSARALAALDRPSRANPAERCYAARSPSFKKPRDDPRFMKLMAIK